MEKPIPGAPEKLIGKQIRAAAETTITSKYSDSAVAQQRSEIVRSSAIAAIDAGYNVIDVGRGGKRPNAFGWQNTLRDKSFLSGPQFDALGNYGIKTGQQYLIDENGAIIPDLRKAWLLVIDFDRNKDVDGSKPENPINAFRDEFVGREGEDAHKQFMNAAGQAESPNGEHLYCLLPFSIKMKGIAEIKKFPVSQGGDGGTTDLRCRNNQVLAHGSETATVYDTDGSIAQHGGIYRWKPGGFKRYCDLPTLPESMCNWFADAIITIGSVTPESSSAPFGMPIPDHAKNTGLTKDNLAAAFESSIRRKKDANRVKDALLHSIRVHPQRYVNYDWWLGGIALPLTGAVATGELTEEEGKSIFDAACFAAPGSQSDNETQWTANLRNARERLKEGFHVSRS